MTKCLRKDYHIVSLQQLVRNQIVVSYVVGLDSNISIREYLVFSF
jgi:hypothetical protein